MTAVRPIKPFITVCGWCPDRAEQTASARAQGFEVSHGICFPCAAKLEAAMDAFPSERDDVRAERLREAVDL